MRLYGHQCLGQERFVFVRDLEQLQTCKFLPCFDRTCKCWMDMAKYCREHDLEFAMIASEDIDVAYAMFFDANFLIARESLSNTIKKIKNWQNILQDYVSDVKLLFVVHNEGEIQNALEQRLDAVVLAQSIEFCSE